MSKIEFLKFEIIIFKELSNETQVTKSIIKSASYAYCFTWILILFYIERFSFIFRYYNRDTLKNQNGLDISKVTAFLSLRDRTQTIYYS